MAIKTGRTTPRNNGRNSPEAHRAEAWRLFCEGVYTYRSIANGVNAKFGSRHDHHWAKRALEAYSDVVAPCCSGGHCGGSSDEGRCPEPCA